MHPFQNMSCDANITLLRKNDVPHVQITQGKIATFAGFFFDIKKNIYKYSQFHAHTTV